MALFYCGMLWAQQRIKGQVLDALDNTSLMGVSVYFDGTSIGTITDESGIFELPLAQKINAALVVSYLGYETRSIADLQNLSKGFTAKIYLAVGFGRTAVGKVGNGIGVNTNALLPASVAVSTAVSATASEVEHGFASVQLAHTMMGRKIVNEISLPTFIFHKERYGKNTTDQN